MLYGFNTKSININYIIISIHIISCMSLFYVLYVFNDLRFLAHSGTAMDSQTIGIAYVGTMCTSTLAVGIVHDYSSALSVSSTASHELGHILSMVHDTGKVHIIYMVSLHLLCICMQATVSAMIQMAAL